MRRGEATGNTQNRAQRLHTAPMEMIPKNVEKRKFHDLEKHEMRANLDDFWGKREPLWRETQPTLRFNVS